MGRVILIVLLLAGLAAAPTTAPTSRPAVIATTAPTTAPTPKPKVTSVAVDPAAVPESPGYTLIHPTLVIDDKPTPFNCGLLIPKPGGPGKPPLVIHLHNRFVIGLKDPVHLLDEGLGWTIKHKAIDGRFNGEMVPEAIDLSADPPFVTLIPMLPGGQEWESPAMLRVMRSLIPQVIAATGADPDRVYLTGFSYGGSSTWVIASAMPELFAAIAPCDGRATSDPTATVARLKHVAVYLSVGGGDNDFLPEAKRMRDALSALPHPYFVSRVIPRGNHFCYEAVYRDPAFWRWLFEQRRYVPPVPKPRPATRPNSRP